MIDLMLGTSVFVTGVEDDQHGAVRVYVGPRWERKYFLVTDPEQVDTCRRGWASHGHVFMSRDQVPWEVLLCDAEVAG